MLFGGGQPASAVSSGVISNVSCNRRKLVANLNGTLILAVSVTLDCLSKPAQLQKICGVTLFFDVLIFRKGNQGGECCWSTPFWRALFVSGRPGQGQQISERPAASVFIIVGFFLSRYTFAAGVLFPVFLSWYSELF